nr:MAG TPA: hypothetical protein [Caudoviricetes sp.]
MGSRTWFGVFNAAKPPFRRCGLRGGARRAINRPEQNMRKQ